MVIAHNNVKQPYCSQRVQSQITNLKVPMIREINLTTQLSFNTHEESKSNALPCRSEMESHETSAIAFSMSKLI